jgi:hypothetical protein
MAAGSVEQIGMSKICSAFLRCRWRGKFTWMRQHRLASVARSRNVASRLQDPSRKRGRPSEDQQLAMCWCETLAIIFVHFRTVQRNRASAMKLLQPADHGRSVRSIAKRMGAGGWGLGALCRETLLLRARGRATTRQPTPELAAARPLGLQSSWPQGRLRSIPLVRRKVRPPRMGRPCRPQ